MDYNYFMNQALEQGKKALVLGEFPVGCVIVGNNEILATGFRTGTTGAFANEVDHAEMIALKQLASLDINRKNMETALFTTMEPCLMCLGATILGGIRKVVYALEDVMGGGTSCDFKSLAPLYKNAGMTIVPHILRSESLALFKDFFRNPENIYWKESLLSDYILSQ